MKRLNLTVEGQTEAGFAITVLTPHLANFNVFLNPPRFTGLHRRRRGRIPQGGLLHTFCHSLSDVRDWLAEDRSPDARFSTMIDLYSLPGDFPGYEEGMKQTTGREQARALQQSLAEVVADHRFIPYLQVHEYEALVLVEPHRLTTLYEIPQLRIESLCRECAKFDSPEAINHGRQSHPKYRLQQCAIEYDENIAGPLLAEAAGLPLLRERCLHFGDWLTRLESLDT